MTFSMRTIALVGTLFALMLLTLVFLAGRNSAQAVTHYQPTKTYKTYHHTYKSHSYRKV